MSQQALSDVPQFDETHCPHCGAQNQTAGRRCWMCRQEFNDAIITAKVIAPPPALRPPKFVPQTFSFSLASVFAIITLVAVGLGLAQIEPGLGILFAIVCSPALVVTFVRTRLEQRTKGRQVGWGERVLTFIISSAAVFGVLVTMQIAMVIALLAICLLILAGASVSGNL